MLLIRILRTAIKNSNVHSTSCNFHMSSMNLLDDRWRRMNRLPANPTSFGPLTNMPDYSFKDGRPAPYGVKQMIRINKQRAYFGKIKTLNDEIDYAVERHARLEREKVLHKQKIIDSKLKPKGHLP